MPSGSHRPVNPVLESGSPTPPLRSHATPCPTLYRRSGRWCPLQGPLQAGAGGRWLWTPYPSAPVIREAIVRWVDPVAVLQVWVLVPVVALVPLLELVLVLMLVGISGACHSGGP